MRLATLLSLTHTFYHNDPNFLNRQILTNSADPNQTAPLGEVRSGSSMFAIFKHIKIKHRLEVLVHERAY